MLEADTKEAIEFLQMMTPSDIKVLSGSSDGGTAILKVEGSMDGEKHHGEITLVKMGELWVTTKESWE